MSSNASNAVVLSAGDRIQEQADFWNRRYAKEGAIWGEMPSPTARVASVLLLPQSTVLDIGFGYGRDLFYLIDQNLHVSGVEISAAGHEAAAQTLKARQLVAENLWLGSFDEGAIPQNYFAAAVSHRMAHLLLTQQSVDQFVNRLADVLKIGGLAIVAARNRQDLNPQLMNEVIEGVFEYKERPGHLIRYWDEESFVKNFSPRFEILTLIESVERESIKQATPCYFTIMVARRLR